MNEDPTTWLWRSSHYDHVTKNPPSKRGYVKIAEGVA